MLRSAIIVVRCCRPYLWVPIFANSIAAGLSVGMATSVSVAVGTILSCLASFGFLLNDILDRRIDKIDRKGRLEDAPAGTIAGAGATGAALAGAGVVLAALTGRYAVLALTLVVLIGLVMYNAALRRVPFVATGLAACLCVSPLWFVMGAEWENVTAAHVLVLKMAVICAFAREVILDLKDLKGDRAFGRYTIPSLLGHRVACVLAVELTLACCGFGVASLLRSPVGPLAVLWIAVFVALVLWLFLRPTLAVLRSGGADAFRVYVAATRTGLLVVPTFLLLGTIVL